MIPLFKPYMPQLEHLNSILYSGKLTSGNYLKNFEEQLREMLNNENVLVTNSFSNAIYISLKALGIRAGDEIIASPMGCLASMQPYAAYGLKVIFADVDPERGTLDPDDVKRRISVKTKAIIHNHFCGYIGYVDEVNKIARDNGIIVINDCIEAFGSEYKGKIIGNDGADATIFSFGPVRTPNTIEGGAIAFRDKANYEKSILLRDLGIDRNNFRDSLGEISPACDINTIGYSGVMNEVNAYIGYCYMKDIKRILVEQRKNALKWDEFFSSRGVTLGTPISNSEVHANYWVYGILTDNKREKIEFFREKGYYASSVHISLNHYSIFKNNDKLLGTDKFLNSFLALPCGWWIENNWREIL